MAVELYLTSLFNDANLVGYYRFEGNSTDSSTAGRNGTDTSISYGTGSGYFNQGASFNGSSSFISLSGTGLPDGADTRTYMAWVNVQSAPSSSTEQIFLCGSAGTNDRVGLAYIDVGGTKQLRFNIYSNDYDVNQTLTVGTWYHVAGTYNGTNVELYVNGSSIGSTAKTINNTTGNTAWGRRSDGTADYFNGYIDDGAIFSRNLSSTEISNYYNGILALRMGGNFIPFL